jgi:hypothetical protein
VRTTLIPKCANAFESAGATLKHVHSELIISRRKLRQADVIELVRRRREAAHQTLGFASRPFVLCGLRSRNRKGTNSCMSAGMENSCYRLPAIQAMGFLGGRIDWFRSFSQRSPYGSSVRRFASGARLKCSTRSGCSKVERSTAV